MLFSQIAINFSLYIGALLSIFINRKNFISILIGMELLLLSINLNFIFISFYLNDITGYIFSIFILAIAAAESAIGLSLIVVFYRYLGNISMYQNFGLRD